MWFAATAPPEEAVVAPQPAGRHTVDQAVEEREQDVEGEVGPLGDGARHDGGAGSGVSTQMPSRLRNNNIDNRFHCFVTQASL